MLMTGPAVALEFWIRLGGRRRKILEKGLRKGPCRYHKTVMGLPSLDQLKSHPVMVIIKPRIITRIFAWIFSIIASASLLSGGFQNVPTSSKLNCILNDNSAACGYGIGIGIMASLFSLLFLLLEVAPLSIFSDLMQKIILFSDIICSVLCTILWFIGFCFLTHQWSLSTPYTYLLGAESAYASITASFFSFLCWVGLSFLAFVRFRSITKYTSEDTITTFKNNLSSSKSDCGSQSSYSATLANSPFSETS